MNRKLRACLAIVHPERRSPVVDVLQYCFVMIALVWFTFRGAEGLGYDWQWYRVGEYLWTTEGGEFHLGPLLTGLGVTFQITVWSMLLSVFFGLVAVLLRFSSSVIGHWLAVGYVESIRNTPLLIQLFVIYFVIAPVFDMERFPSAVLALSLFEGAYMAEIFRAGILSVPTGQWEASYSLGLNSGWTYWEVVLPQAVRNVLPPLAGQAITLVKDSALVSTIAIYDLTMQGQAIISETFLTFEIWFTVAAIYLLVTLSLSIAVHVMERRLKYDV